MNDISKKLDADKNLCTLVNYPNLTRGEAGYIIEQLLKDDDNEIEHQLLQMKNPAEVIMRLLKFATEGEPIVEPAEVDEEDEFDFEDDYATVVSSNPENIEFTLNMRDVSEPTNDEIMTFILGDFAADEGFGASMTEMGVRILLHKESKAIYERACANNMGKLYVPPSIAKVEPKFEQPTANAEHQQTVVDANTAIFRHLYKPYLN